MALLGGDELRRATPEPVAGQCHAGQRRIELAEAERTWSSLVASRSSARSTAACVRRAMRWARSDSEAATIDAGLRATAAIVPRPLGRDVVGVDGVDQAAGARGRRLERGVSDLVGHAAVDLVAETGEAWIGLVTIASAIDSASNVASSLRRAARMTTTQSRSRPPSVGSRRRPSPPPTRPARGRRRSRGGTRTRCGRSRRGSRAMPPSRRWQRHQPAAGSATAWSVGVDQADGDEAPDDLVARLRQLTQREAGIDPGHLQAESSGRGVVVELAEDPDPSCRRPARGGCA